MMSPKMIAPALFLLSANMPSQTPPAVPAKPAAIISPEILPDHRVVFRLRAPRATEVKVNGDFWLQQDRTEKLTEDAEGVWSLTTEPLPSNYYSYSFTLDGVHLPDPANGLTKPGISETQSAFFVPGPEASLLQTANVPHGEIRTVYYSAASLGQTRRMHVYLPPGYEGSKTRYPVMYLLHGGGDDDGTWESVGRVNFILDNLIAQGKAKPMIVVMPTLWALDPPVTAPHRAENEALFAKTLRKDIIPYVDAQFKVLPGSAHRAVGGLGDGRDFLPNLIWKTVDEFDSVLFVSGGADKDRFAVLQAQYPGLIDKPANASRVKFYIGGGTTDRSFASGKNLSEELTKRGYKVRMMQSDNTHGWPEFRYNFVQFALAAFR